MSESKDPSARAAAAHLQTIIDKGTDAKGQKAQIHYEKVQLPVNYEENPNMLMGEKSTAENVRITPLLDL